MRVTGGQQPEEAHEELCKEQAADERGDVGLFREQVGAGEKAVDEQAAEEYHRGGAAGDAQRKQRGSWQGATVALFALSAAQTPSGSPVPNRSGFLSNFWSGHRDMSPATCPPAPGMTPMMVPMRLPMPSVRR